MKQTLLLTLFFVFCASAFGNTYYFSSSEGNDSYTPVEAQSPNTPWKSLEKLNRIFSILRPGDIIKFKCGDVFYGNLNVIRSGAPNNPIIFEEYGSGEKPVLTSFISLKNWISKEDKIHQSKLPIHLNQLNVVILNGQIYPKGRFPNQQAKNSGYLTIEETNKGYVTNREILKMTDFTGGEIVIRKNNWVIDRHTILSQKEGKISYDPDGSGYDPQNGYGFFIQNHPATLDLNGEWYFDAQNQQLYLYSDQNLENQDVRVSSKDGVLRILNKSSHIIFRNLDFTGANENLVEVQNSENIQFQYCNFSFAGNFAILATNTKNLVVENSTIENILNGGIFLSWQDRNSTIKNNYFDRIFNFAGMGRNSDMQSQVIYMSETSSDGLIEANRIKNSGYIAINFNGDNTIVKENYIDNFCFVKDDGAGIYTFVGISGREYFNMKIINNEIANGIGAVDGTKPFHPDDLPYVEGIYLDDNSKNVEISGNTISNVRGSGIYINKSSQVAVINNIIKNTGHSMKFSSYEESQPIRNITVKGNQFLISPGNRKHFHIFPPQDNLNRLGTFENNVFK
jgi:parallel beta-helix repeat protein